MQTRRLITRRYRDSRPEPSSGLLRESGRRGRPVVVNRGLIAETGVIPVGMRFLQDSYAFRPLDMKKGLTEGKGGREQVVFRVTGLFQECDKKNANGRIYPRDILAKAVEQIQEDTDRRSVMGEFDHPPDAKIHLDRVSHLVTKVWMEGRKVYGEAEVLDSQPYGRCLRGLFEQKVQTGISSRGIGDMEVRESGGEEYYEVLPGYSFVTWDVVAEPSVTGATLNVMEGLRRKVAPIHQARRSGELSKEAYERHLLLAVNQYLGLS